MISVVIPTKNDEKVFDTINSVFDQTYKKNEIIVVDGSSGAHKESLESFCNERKVDYFHRDFEEKDLQTIRNLGVEKSQGGIVALLEGCCVADEKWLENLLSYFENHDIVESNINWVSEGEKPFERVENSGRNYNFIQSGLAFRRKVWEDQQFREDLSVFGTKFFGFEALENNYAYTYGQQAKIRNYKTGLPTSKFLRDGFRHGEVTKLIERLGDNPQIDVPRLGKAVYPRELFVLAGFVAALSMIPINSALSSSLAVLMFGLAGALNLDGLGAGRTLKTFGLSLPRIAVKRYAIWSSSLREGRKVF